MTLLSRLRNPEGIYTKHTRALAFEAADEIDRLRAAVWVALPWLEDLEHLGDLVDHTRLQEAIEKMRAALGLIEGD